MFGKWQYQNKINDEIIEAAQEGFGKMRGWNDVMEFRVDGSAIGAAVDSLYKKASPLIAAQATIVTQIEICRINNDKKNIEKWSKVLSILEEKEVKISVGKTGY